MSAFNILNYQRFSYKIYSYLLCFILVLLAYLIYLILVNLVNLSLQSTVGIIMNYKKLHNY